MKPARWACCRRWCAGLVAALVLPLAVAQALAPVSIEVQLSDAATPAGLSAVWEPAVRREDWARSHPGLADGQGAQARHPDRRGFA
jgi:hypothetical protein